MLDAAASCVRDFGIERVTLAEVARRAGVSRPTVYRRWAGTDEVLTSLLTRQITGAVDTYPLRGPSRADLIGRLIAVVGILRSDPIVSAVLSSAPTVAMVYITERLGSSQLIVIEALADAIVQGQQHGSVRGGDCRKMAAVVLLTAQSALQSAQLVSAILDADALDAELAYLLNGYLAS